MTRVTLTIAGTRPGVSMQIDLDETYDRVVDLLIPLDQPSSALEARQQRTFKTISGHRVMFHPNLVAVIEEGPDDGEQ